MSFKYFIPLERYGTLEWYLETDTRITCDADLDPFLDLPLSESDREELQKFWDLSPEEFERLWPNATYRTVRSNAVFYDVEFGDTFSFIYYRWA